MVQTAPTHDSTGLAFGRLPSLTHQIKELIHDYPEGIGIVKELLQNADDAAARSLHVLADWRSHPAAALPAPAMAGMQGPALLFWNDAVFSEDDFDRIQELYQSGKVRSAEKTGQFGKGFNTVYNVTDWPAFVTGERVAFFDPHTATVPGATSTAPGRYWALSVCWQAYPDLLIPFTAAGLKPGQVAFPGSAFRLPLRTPEQAAVSEISHRPFTAANWKELLGQLLGVREELLLFLKNVEELLVTEILADGSERRELLSVRTSNVEEVRSARERVLAVLRGDAASVVERLTGIPPFRVPYVHRFESRWLDADAGQSAAHEETSAWRAVACLALDTEGEIARAVEELQERDVKAVPLGGAAARIERIGRGGRAQGQITGRAYCSLPLPLETGFPVHLNGFFDLDSSRHALTTDSGQTGSARVRVRWNELLVRHVVAQAYAQLIYNLTGDVGEKNPQYYYGLWPEARRRPPKPFDTLASEVYRYMATWPVIRATGKDRWTSIAAVSVLPTHWEELTNPLVAQGVALPDPVLKSTVTGGFTKAEVSVNVFEPRQLRQLLRQQQPLAVRPEAASLPCLRQRAWLEILLRFCLTDEPRDLAGLPLALMADGVLRTFGHIPQTPIYLAGPQERTIFAHCPAWFVDEGFALSTALRDKSRAGFVWMSPEEVLARLQEVLPKTKVHILLPELEPAKFLNAAWLIEVYEYLTGAVRRGFRPEQAMLQAIPLVPDQEGRLQRPGFANTPLLLRDRASERLRGALRAFKVPLVTAPPTMEEALVAFNDACPCGFIWPLTGPDLVDTLATLPAADFPPYNREAYGPLLDFLARAEWRGESGGYAQAHVEKLRRLPIYPTTADRGVSLEENVHLPADFQPPKAGPQLTLLWVGENGAWRAFLRFLGVPVLNRYTFLGDYLLPVYAELPPPQQLVALRWLRDHLQQAESEMERDGGDLAELREVVAGADLVRCEDGELRPARAVYHPVSQVIRDLLGSAAAFPDMGYYVQGAERWLAFFRELGMSDQLRAQDLLGYVDQLEEEAGRVGASRVQRPVLKVYEYLDAHWAELRDEPVEDAEGETFAEVLHARAWLPAERTRRKLNRWPGATVPEDRLYRPCELYLPRQANLVVSQCPIFPMPRENARLREDLGFPTRPPLEVVVAHFDRLLDLWGGPELRKPPQDTYEASLREVYRYLGSGPDAPSGDPDGEALHTRYAGRPCLWHDGQLWKPEHTFQVPVPFFGGRRVSIALKPPLLHAYQRLGLRKKPELDDYLTDLGELRDRFGAEPLPVPEVEQLLELYRRLGHELAQHQGLVPRFPLLSRQGCLLAPEAVFFGDAPWFEERLTGADLRLLHRDLPTTVSHLPWVRSLARAIVEEPRGTWREVDDPTPRGRAERLQATLRSPEFRRGLARLIAHEYGSCRQSTLEWLEQAAIVAVREILTDLYLNSDGTRTLVGSGTTNHYADRAAKVFYLAGGAGKLMRRYLAEMVNATLGGDMLHDLSGLTEVLDCEPGEIEHTLTQLRIKPLEDEPEPWTEEAEAGWEDAAEAQPAEGPDEASQPEVPDAGGQDAPDEESEEVPPVAEEADRHSGDGEPATAASPAPAASQPLRQPDGADRPGREGRQESSPDPEKGLNVWGSSGTGRGRREAPSRRHAAPGAAAAPRATSGEEATGGEHVRDSDAVPAPVRMRPARGRRRRNERRSDRMVTYVTGDLSAGGAATHPAMSEKERRHNIDLGNRAVVVVCAFEEAHSRKPTPRGQTHPGYDIDSHEPVVDSLDRKSGTERSIEVKGIFGPWTRQGVALSPRQFRAARELGDRFWLYVVEHADDPSRSIVHPIQNPFAKVTGYWFDRGWMQIVDPGEAPSRQGRAEIGQRISIANVGEGTISDITQRGALRVLIIRLDDGREIKRPFNPRTMKASGQEKGGDDGGTHDPGPF